MTSDSPLRIEDDRDMLGAVGLSEVEERIYRGLLPHAARTVRECAEDAAISEHDARGAIGALETKGLVVLRPGKPRRYSAIQPDIALEALVHQHEAELRNVRAAIGALSEEFRRATNRSPLEVAEIVTGAEAVSQYVGLMQRHAERRVLIFDRPPYFPTPGNPEEDELLRRGIEYRVIYEHSSLEVAGALEAVQKWIEAGEQARLVATLPMKLVVVDDSLAIVPLYPLMKGGLAIRSSPLLDGIVTLFESLWGNALPLRIIGRDMTPGDPDDTISEEERSILALLATGQKDEAIARRLGVTPRTVQRRVTELMHRLGATNRYQAGLKAGLRGWY